MYICWLPQTKSMAQIPDLILGPREMSPRVPAANPQERVEAPNGSMGARLRELESSSHLSGLRLRNLISVTSLSRCDFV